MTQYDAGPGDRSDRPWDDPNKKPKPQARRRRLALPPWALLAILVAIIILLCVGLILVVQAIRGRGGNETPTPIPTPTRQSLPTNTAEPPSSIPTITPTHTITLPVDAPEPSPTPSAIGPGTMVVVQGTLGGGLNIREQPTTNSRTVASVKEGTTLVVLDGPKEADGYVWWQVRTPEGDEGWAAANWLVLKTEP